MASYSIGQYHSVIDKSTIGTNEKSNLYCTPISLIDGDDDRTNGIQAIGVQALLSSNESYDEEKVTFKDNAIILGDGYFSSKECYYLKFKIKRNIAYDINYDIRLAKFSEVDENDSFIKYTYNESDLYQHLKRVTVKKGSSSDENKTLPIYAYKEKNEDGNVVIKLETLSNIDDEIPMEPYTDENGKVYEPQRGMIDISAWLDSDASFGNTEEVCIAFNPCADDFNGIIIKKQIETIDYQLSYIEKANGESKLFQGIKTEIFEPELYELTNIVDKNNMDIQDGRAIKKIGIWGRSGLGFMINNEEIHIGSRGYYEVDIDDFIITSICPIALYPNDKDRFLIDYECIRA